MGRVETLCKDGPRGGGPAVVETTEGCGWGVVLILTPKGQTIFLH
jgi:hypothetical protein